MGVICSCYAQLISFEIGCFKVCEHKSTPSIVDSQEQKLEIEGGKRGREWKHGGGHFFENNSTTLQL